jgi:hypothetical protein
MQMDANMQKNHPYRLKSQMTRRIRAFGAFRVPANLRISAFAKKKRGGKNFF